MTRPASHAGLNTHLSDMIVQMFGGTATIITSGDYHFAYQDSPGHPGYVQDQSGLKFTVSGHVTGH